jgi:mycothiol synthase
MRLRAATELDAEAAHAVIAARDTHDLGVVDFTLADLREEWGFPDVEIAKDVVLGKDASGQVVAYGIARRMGVMAIVHPEHEGKGWGSLLLEWAERREAERGDSFRRQWINEGNARAKALLEGAGYEWQRSYARMRRTLDGPLPEVAVPDGVVLRSLDVAADAEVVWKVDAAAFGGAPDFDQVTLEQFRKEGLETHDFDPAASFVAEREGEIVGFVVCKRWEEDDPPAGYVSILGVDPPAQGAGIGSALLMSAFRAFADAGLREAVLGVSMENPRALRIYERAGMTKRFGFETYERPLRDDERTALDDPAPPLESPVPTGD